MDQPSSCEEDADDVTTFVVDVVASDDVDLLLPVDVVFIVFADRFDIAVFVDLFVLVVFVDLFVFVVLVDRLVIAVLRLPFASAVLRLP